MARENTSFAGIVMYRRPYKERDLLVKFLTDKRGPMMFFVRGGNRSHAKITSDILPFTHGQYTGWLADDGSLSYLSAARDTRQYVHLGEDPLRSAYATYILELVDATFEEGRSIGGWFNQVAAALSVAHSVSFGIIRSVTFKISGSILAAGAGFKIVLTPCCLASLNASSVVSCGVSNCAITKSAFAMAAWALSTSAGETHWLAPP